MSIDEVERELDQAWLTTYSPASNQRAIEWFEGRDLNDQIMLFITRMFFRGIYFPQRTKRVWVKAIVANRRSIYKLVKTGLNQVRSRSPQPVR